MSSFWNDTYRAVKRENEMIAKTHLEYIGSFELECKLHEKDIQYLRKKHDLLEKSYIELKGHYDMNTKYVEVLKKEIKENVEREIKRLNEFSINMSSTFVSEGTSEGKREEAIVKQQKNLEDKDPETDTVKCLMDAAKLMDDKLKESECELQKAIERENALKINLAKLEEVNKKIEVPNVDELNMKIEKLEADNSLLEVCIDASKKESNEKDKRLKEMENELLERKREITILIEKSQRAESSNNAEKDAYIQKLEYENLLLREDKLKLKDMCKMNKELNDANFALESQLRGLNREVMDLKNISVNTSDPKPSFHFPISIVRPNIAAEKKSSENRTIETEQAVEKVCKQIQFN
jgi:outer membrane murein-binding lipoprotein Lpp